MQKLISAALVPALIASGPATSQTVTVRPVRQPTPELDRKVALGARATALTRASYPDAADMTGGAVIRALCGDVRQAYVTALEETNGPTLQRAYGSAHLPLDRKLGGLAYEISWPACLIVNSQPARQTITPGRPPDVIYRELTGDRGSQSAVAKFFGMTYSALRGKKIGDHLPADRLTLPVTLNVQSSELAQAIEVLRDKAEKASDPPARIIQTTAAASTGPKIIIGTGTLSALATPAECAGAVPPSPLRRARVLAALGRAREALLGAHRSQSSAEVMVVDNGYLGAVKTVNGVMARPGFPDSFQARRYGGNVGPALELDRGPVLPLIDPPQPWSDVAGHGTHVAGLAAGGPDLQPGLEPLVTQAGVGSQLTIAMVNVGAGSADLLPGSAEALRRLTRLTHFRIWNFSLEYPDTSNNDIHRAFTDLFDSQSEHLYVAAAGNDGHQVTNRYPAAFGGMGKPNVITVGATLPDGTLAAFSDWGSQVDIAAPGCEVQSTIDEAAHVRGMSGTSQAAPQVSFAAALLRILGGLDAAEIKRRIIASGSLIKAPPAAAGATRQPGMVWSRSALDLERVVDMFEDFVELTDGRQYVGSIDAFTGATCQKTGFTDTVDVDDLWSFKKGAAGAWIFYGRNTSTLAQPCAWVEGSGTLSFIPTKRVEDDGYHDLAADDPALATGSARVDLPLASVSRLIVGYDVSSLQ